MQIKQHLDYLLNEAKITIEDITLHPSIFKSSLDELKIRVNELRSLGLLFDVAFLKLDRKGYLERIKTRSKYKIKINDEHFFNNFHAIEDRIKSKKM